MATKKEKKKMMRKIKRTKWHQKIKKETLSTSVWAFQSNILHLIVNLIFSPILGKLSSGQKLSSSELRENTVGPHNFSLPPPLLSQPNTLSINFLSYFSLPFLHPLQNHSFQTYSRCTGHLSETLKPTQARSISLK